MVGEGRSGVKCVGFFFEIKFSFVVVSFGNGCVGFFNFFKEKLLIGNW